MDYTTTRTAFSYTHPRSIARLSLTSAFVSALSLGHANSASANQDIAPAVRERIERSLNQRRAALFEPSHGMSVGRKTYTGQQLLLGVGLDGVTQISNRVPLYYADLNDSQAKSRLLELRIDPARSLYADIEVADLGLEDATVLVRRLTLPHSGEWDFDGRYEIQVGFRDAERRRQFAIAHYELHDGEVDVTLPESSQAPLRTIEVDIACVGDARDELAMQHLSDDLSQRFLRATRGHVALEPTLLGCEQLPEDGEDLAGSLHAYSDWWRTLPQTPPGDAMRPLDPEQAEDRALVRLAWYDQNKRQLDRDIRELYGFDNAELRRRPTVVYADASYWAAGGAWYATVPRYTNFGGMAFMQKQDGQPRYGFAAGEFAGLSHHHEQTIALHELGHLLALAHPGYSYTTDETTGLWQTRSSDGVAAMHVDVMHQGLNREKSSDVFYNSGDILRLLGAEAPGVAGTERAMPNLDRTANTWAAAVREVTGTKPAGAAIVVNGEELVPASPATQWRAELVVEPGSNRYEIAAEVAGVVSQPRVLEIEGLDPAELGLADQVELSLRGSMAGGITTVTLRAEDPEGLKNLWFWVYRIQDGQRRYLPYVGQWGNLHGAARKQLSYRVVLEQAGEYEFCARSRDLAYGHGGAAHQSPVRCERIDINS